MATMPLHAIFEEVEADRPEGTPNFLGIRMTEKAALDACHEFAQRALAGFPVGNARIMAGGVLEPWQIVEDVEVKVNDNHVDFGTEMVEMVRLTYYCRPILDHDVPDGVITKAWIGDV